MTPSSMLPLELYPALAQVQPSLASLCPTVAPMQVLAGTVLFDENAPCRGFPLVLTDRKFNHMWRGMAWVGRTQTRKPPLTTSAI